MSMGAANPLTSCIIACKMFLRRNGTVGRALARTIHVRRIEMAPLPSNNTGVLYIDYSGAGENFNSAWYMDFVGRSIDGRRCRISWFGLVVDFDAVNDDYRLLAGENSNVADVLTALDFGSDVPVSISGQAVNWHQYANIGQNAYWRNHIRG